MSVPTPPNLAVLSLVLVMFVVWSEGQIVLRTCGGPGPDVVVTPAPDGWPVNVTTINITNMQEGFNVSVPVGAATTARATDLYFLWEAAEPCRAMAAPYWQTNLTPKRLVYTLMAMAATNPLLDVGLGLFTNKRLPGLGTLRTTDTYHSDWVLQSAAALARNYFLVDANMIPQQWAASAPVANVSAALDALAAAAAPLGGGNPGWRPGSRRAVVLAACQLPGEGGPEGDLFARLFGPVGPIGPNLYADELDGSCKLSGEVCPPPCVLQLLGPALIPTVACSCAAVPGSLTIANATQFYRGSCDDYATTAGLQGAAAGAWEPFDLWAYVPQTPAGVDASGGANPALFSQLLAGLPKSGAWGGWKGGVVTNPADLEPLLIANYGRPDGVPPNVTFEPAGLADYVAATWTCSASECVVELQVESGAAPGGVVWVNGEAVQLLVDECRPSNSRSHSHRSHSHRSKSRSHSRSHSHSRSRSKSRESHSHSPSHHSQSKSASHESDSRSPSDSHSTSHHSKSGSTSQSHSSSHESESGSKSQSGSASQHSESGSTSQSGSSSHESESKSGSDSHSTSHGSESGSTSQSHSSSHESESGSGSASRSSSHESESGSGSESRSSSHESESGSISLSQSAVHQTESESESETESESHSPSHSTSHESQSDSGSGSESPSRSASHESASHSLSASHESQSASHESKSASHHSNSESESNSQTAKRAPRRDKPSTAVIVGTSVGVTVGSLIIMALAALAGICCVRPVYAAVDEERRRRRGGTYVNGDSKRRG